MRMISHVDAAPGSDTILALLATTDTANRSRITHARPKIRAMMPPAVLRPELAAPLIDPNVILATCPVTCSLKQAKRQSR